MTLSTSTKFERNFRFQPLLYQFVPTGFTTIVPLIDLPWTLQWYLNPPSFSNFTGPDIASGWISPVSNVLPSSSDVAVCLEKAALLQVTKSPRWITSSLGS